MDKILSNPNVKTITDIKKYKKDHKLKLMCIIS